jgi:hypothetical protein
MTRRCREPRDCDRTTTTGPLTPLSGQSLASVDVEAPVLEALITGGGTAASPLHDVVFHGIQFSYATWMGASSGNGFSEVQANYLVWGTAGPTAGNAEYSWYQIPANVSFTYAQHVQLTGNAFVHLGGTGLALGERPIPASFTIRSTTRRTPPFPSAGVDGLTSRACRG